MMQRGQPIDEWPARVAAYVPNHVLPHLVNDLRGHLFNSPE